MAEPAYKILPASPESLPSNPSAYPSLPAPANNNQFFVRSAPTMLELGLALATRLMRYSIWALPFIEFQDGVNVKPTSAGVVPVPVQNGLDLDSDFETDYPPTIESERTVSHPTGFADVNDVFKTIEEGQKELNKNRELENYRIRIEQLKILGMPSHNEENALSNLLAELAPVTKQAGALGAVASSAGSPTTGAKRGMSIEEFVKELVCPGTNSMVFLLAGDNTWSSQWYSVDFKSGGVSALQVVPESEVNTLRDRFYFKGKVQNRQFVLTAVGERHRRQVLTLMTQQTEVDWGQLPASLLKELCLVWLEQKIYGDLFGQSNAGKGWTAISVEAFEKKLKTEGFKFDCPEFVAQAIKKLGTASAFLHMRFAQAGEEIRFRPMAWRKIGQSDIGAHDFAVNFLLQEYTLPILTEAKLMLIPLSVDGNGEEYWRGLLAQNTQILWVKVPNELRKQMVIDAILSGSHISISGSEGIAVNLASPDSFPHAAQQYVQNHAVAGYLSFRWRKGEATIAGFSDSPPPYPNENNLTVLHINISANFPIQVRSIAGRHEKAVQKALNLNNSASSKNPSHKQAVATTILLADIWHDLIPTAHGFASVPNEDVIENIKRWLLDWAYKHSVPATITVTLHDLGVHSREFKFYKGVFKPLASHLTALTFRLVSEYEVRYVVPMAVAGKRVYKWQQEVASNKSLAWDKASQKTLDEMGKAQLGAMLFKTQGGLSLNSHGYYNTLTTAVLVQLAKPPLTIPTDSPLAEYLKRNNNKLDFTIYGLDHSGQELGSPRIYIGETPQALTPTYIQLTFRLKFDPKTGTYSVQFKEAHGRNKAKWAANWH